MSAMNAKSGMNASMQNDDERVLVEQRDPFKTERDSESYIMGKLVGGHIPLPLAQYLQLLALYHEKSIQKTLKTIIQEWCSDKESEDVIIETLADRAYIEWKRRQSEYIIADSSQRREKYLKEVADRLKKHKVTKKEYVDGVISQLRAKMEM